jgi:hypothetical protein
MSVIWCKKGHEAFIQPTKIAYPTRDQCKLIFENGVYSPIWNNYNKNAMTLTGVLYASNPGIYQVAFSLKENFCWTDGSYQDYIVSWNIYNNVWLVYDVVGETNIYKENFEHTLLNTDKYWVGTSYDFTANPKNPSSPAFTIPGGQYKLANSLGIRKYFLTDANNTDNASRVMGYIKSNPTNTSSDYTRYIYDLYEIVSVNKTGNVLYAVTDNEATTFPENYVHTDGYWYEKQIM